MLQLITLENPTIVGRNEFRGPGKTELMKPYHKLLLNIQMLFSYSCNLVPDGFS